MQVALKYRSSPVSRLFTPAPDLRTHGCFTPASAGFTLGDREILTDLACEASLDADAAGPFQGAPLNALHALMRLGEPALSPAAPRLIARALSLRCYSSDYVTELVSGSLKFALVGCGASALPLIADALVSSARAATTWRDDAWLGVGILSSALAALPFSLGELPAADTAAAALLDCIEAVYLQWRSAASPHRESQRCLILVLSHLVGDAEHLAPVLRAGHAARALGLIRAIKLDRGARNVGPGAPGGGFSFAGFLGAMGIEAIPGDPALAGSSVPTAEDVEKMWRSRHGAGARAPGAPFPGEAGYVPPPIWSTDGTLQWALPMRCGNALCGVDIDAMAASLAGLSDGSGADPMAIMASIMALNDRKSNPAQIAKLQACGNCRAVAYCSPKCQKAHWAMSKAARKAARARKGVDPSAEDIPTQMNAEALLSNHKLACAVTALVVARARHGD